MNYIGLKVAHKRFGEGIVVSQEQSASVVIRVRFSRTGEEKVFSAPGCFESYLRLLSKESEDQVQEAIERDRQEKAAEEEAERQEREERKALLKIQRMREEKPVSFMAVPVYSTMESFCEDQEDLLRAEIDALRKNGGKRRKLFDGRLLERRGSWYVYSFESDMELELPGDTEISIWLRDEPVNGSLISCEEFTVVIASEEDLGKQVSELEFSAEPWKLTEFLIDRLEAMKENPSPIVRSLLFEGRKKQIIWRGVYRGQEKALQMSHDQPITFIWGPPGTGKTEMLARIAVEQIKHGHRVLMLSYSNVSVDGAVWRVVGKATDYIPGQIIRYGYAKDKKLLEHANLTAYNLALRNHPEWEQERIKLIEERKRYKAGSVERIRINKRLDGIRSILSDEEKQIVRRASFVATTVSKATADHVLYENRFDTVIFDEASMAYVPQVVFSAGLATKHFICLGDFSQLPPIVQSSNTSRLNMDIFRYCGIVDAVEKEVGHEWLCMLDVQYRMHPQIAAFAGKTMYHDLLSSHPDMEKKTEPIVRSMPFAGSPMQLLDLSGMMSVCKSTADSSRMNVLSAFLSMALAVCVAQEHEVGIITPYSAQSRLLHAMSRDVMDRYGNLKKITCATVHQFQGSEKDVIVYDAVDCYRSTYPGKMLTSMTNDYANRLFNVALTRARGKMITVVNCDYMNSKGLPNGLMFDAYLDYCAKQRVSGDQIIREINQPVIRMSTDYSVDDCFRDDLLKAKKEILVDIPGKMENDPEYAARFVALLEDARGRGIRVIVRAEWKDALPSPLSKIAVGNEYVYNPVTMIDRNIIWFGQPHSEANFITEGQVLQTTCRPIIRFEGKYTARALFGFLEMNQTVDRSVNALSEGAGLAGFVGRTLRCEQCGAAMRMKISRRGTFFLSCSGYPKCQHAEYIEPELVQKYLDSIGGKRCPVDHTLVTVKAGKRGVRVCCSNVVEKHFFKLDEI